MPHEQAAPAPVDHNAAVGQAVARPGVADLRCVDMSSSGGPYTGDVYDEVDYIIWQSIRNMDQARMKLERSREVAKREKMELCNAVLQQQQDSLNARWSSCYGELQRDGEKTTKNLQKTLKELEDAKVKMQDLTARDKATEVALRELQQTVNRQNDEAAKARSVTETQLMIKEQRITELEAVEKDLAGQLKDEKARHEALERQHAALQDDYAEAVDIASSLTEGPDGTALAEFFGRHRALEQQVRELKADNEAQAEQLRAATASTEQGSECTGDEGRGKRRKRAT